MAIRKPKLPRLLWKRRPQTQMVECRKKYRRRGGFFYTFKKYTRPNYGRSRGKSIKKRTQVELIKCAFFILLKKVYPAIFIAGCHLSFDGLP